MICLSNLTSSIIYIHVLVSVDGSCFFYRCFALMDVYFKMHILFQKILTLLPELIHKRWMFHSIGKIQ